MPEQQKKSDRIAERLSERIVDGRLSPGAKLRQDLLAREFGVSQVTIREALLQLVGRGLAVSLPRRGICVAPMDQGAGEELQVMRAALEPVALYHSVPHLDLAQIARIEEVNDACNAARSATEWERANRRFHMAVIAGCRMPRLVAEIGNLQLLHAWQFNARPAPRWSPRDDPDHAAILSAIRDRDADRARRVMQRHLTRLSPGRR